MGMRLFRRMNSSCQIDQARYLNIFHAEDSQVVDTQVANLYMTELGTYHRRYAKDGNE